MRARIGMGEAFFSSFPLVFFLSYSWRSGLDMFRGMMRRFGVRWEKKGVEIVFYHRGRAGRRIDGT